MRLPVISADMQALLHRLTRFVQQAGLPPYRVDKAKGELKFILLTRSQARGEYLLRFVLRSTMALNVSNANYLHYWRNIRR